MNTTIAISTDVREQIKEFGQKGETYDDVLKRVLKNARERMLHDYLYDTSDSVPIAEALDKAKKRWR